MCGRYTLSHPGDLLAELGVAPSADADLLRPRYNIAPTQSVPAVRERPPEAAPSEDAPDEREPARELVALHWGLIPFWAKERSIGNRMINARSETAASKPAFRAAYKRRRCLLLVDGFYEWVARERGPKQPFHIHRPDRRAFTFAGLWESWDPAKESGAQPGSTDSGTTDSPASRLESCTILTTAASEAMGPYHHRMPVILDGADRDLWLSVDTPPDALGELLGPYTGKLAFTPVSRLVNNPRNEDPRCVTSLVDEA